ncbi:hypothetical protein GCM10020331_041580 [Ectobacillus funiculus]
MKLALQSLCQKGSDKTEQFNAVLKEMKENGEMDKLIKKWFEGNK